MRFSLIVGGLSLVAVAYFIRWLDPNNALALVTAFIAGLFVASGIVLEEDG